MCPQPVVVAAATAIIDSNRTESSVRRRHQQQQVASAKRLFRKRLCVHPTTMFRIALKINDGLIRSPKMVKYSAAAPCWSCFPASPLY
uniref:Uncharacterized protein n=1 Tax=Anopheles dirus TaxID=7168 RepID=A0A182NEU7_9DIPT